MKRIGVKAAAKNLVAQVIELARDPSRLPALADLQQFGYGKTGCTAKHSHGFGRVELYFRIGSGLLAGASKPRHDFAGQQLFFRQ